MRELKCKTINKNKKYNKKCKVLLITMWFLEYTIELANSLSKYKNFEVSLIIPTDYKIYLNNDITLLLNNEVKLYYCGSVRTTLILLKLPLLVFSMTKYIKNIKPDIIHIQLSGKMLIILLMLIFILRNYRIILTLHDPKPRNGETDLLSFIKYQLSKFLLRTINILLSNNYFIIVHGVNLKRDSTLYLKINSEKIYVIPHGEFSIFKKWKVSGKDKINNIEINNNTYYYILFFGGINKRKGLEYLIMAEPYISKFIFNYKIIIAGKCDNFKKYEKIMANKSKFICYIKYIPNSMVRKLFEKADIVVLPYIGASQSGVVPIAYAFKKPVVVTNVGSLPEVVENGKTGLIVQPRDQRALADAIIKLLNDVKNRKRMGYIAYKVAKKRLSWDLVAEKTIMIYKKLLNN